MIAKAVTILRWILVPCAALVAWYVAFFTGLLIRGVVHSLAFPFCRDKRVISNDEVCMDRWFAPLLDIAMYAGAGFAGFLILVSCVGVAPAHKGATARVTFVVGAAFAIFVAISSDDHRAYLSMISAVSIGAVTASWLAKTKNARARAA